MKTYNCTIDNFNKIFPNKRIVCFGASQAAKIFCQNFEDYQIENNIDFFVDNDTNKWGEKILINKKSFMIKPPSALKEVTMKNKIIFITSRFWHEIHQQLDKIEELTDVECYIFILFKMHKSIEKMNIENELDMEIQIPKTIHYCWFGGGNMPKVASECMQSWKRYCPDYEIIEWNENNYNVYKNRFTKEVYDYGHYSALSSYARFNIIYQYGGIYLDTDVEIIRNIDKLLHHEAFMGFEVSNYINSGHGFGGKSGNNLFKENVDIYDRMSFFDEKGIFKYKQAPVITTEMLLQHGLKLNGDMQKVENIIIYPSDYFDPAMQIPVENTFSVHRYSSLWSIKGKDMQEIWERQREYYLRLVREDKIEEI